MGGGTGTTQAARAEVTLRPGVRKWGGYLLLMLILGASGVFMVQDGRPVGWAALAVSVPGAVLMAWGLLSKRMRLRLTQAGFEFGTARKQYSYLWSDVEASAWRTSLESSGFALSSAPVITVKSGFG